MAETNVFVDVVYKTTYSILPAVIMCILGVVSNVLLLVALITDPLKCFRNAGTYLVMNLSVSDCLTCLISSVVYIRGRSHGRAILYFAMYWPASVSIVSIASISIDRFLIVAYPIKHRILVKGKVMILWIAAIWMISCVIPIFRLFSDDRVSETIDKSIMNIVPVIIIILSSFMYSSTYYKLKKQSRNIALQNSNDIRAQEIRNLKERRFIQTIIIIACTAFVSVVPSLIFSMVYNSLGFNIKAWQIVGEISIFILCLNFAVNPFIYILRLPNYRKTFYLLYCKRGTASS